jgi:hypothetical protein
MMRVPTYRSGHEGPQRGREYDVEPEVNRAAAKCTLRPNHVQLLRGRRRLMPRPQPR